MDPNAIRTRNVNINIGDLLDDVATNGSTLAIETMGRLVEGLMVRMPQPRLLVSAGRAFAGGRTLHALKAFMNGDFELAGTLLDNLAGKRWATMGYALQIRLLNGPIDVTYIESDYETTTDIMNAYLLAVG